jgi:hypothetical protein
MSTKTLAYIKNRINDRRRDSGNFAVDMTAEGFRAIQTIIDFWQQNHDWEFTIQKETFNFYKGITWYSTPIDFKVDIDLTPKRNSQKSITFQKVSAGDFDSAILKLNRYAIVVDNRIKYLRMESNLGSTAQVHSLTNPAEDGTLVGAGDISNVAQDSYETFDFASSISFDFDGTSGTLTNSTMTAKDLSKYLNRSKIFMNVYLPIVSNFTSIALKVGSDDSNYYLVTATTDYLGNTPEIGWNKFEFDIWDSSVGSPDMSNVDYFQLTFTYGSSTTATGFRIENLFISEEVPIYLEYYSNYMVYDVSDSSRVKNFNDASATTDYPLWDGDGDWEFVTNSFVEACLVEINLISGEIDDATIAQERQSTILTDLKQRLPSRRRRPQLQFSLE